MRRLIPFVVTLALIVGAVLALVFLDASDGTNGQSSGQWPPWLELKPGEIPEFATWEQLQDFISSSHDRLEAFARSEPNHHMAATVSPTRGLTTEEVATLIEEHGVEVNHVSYTSGRAGGERYLPPNVTLASIEDEYRARRLLAAGERLLFTELEARGRAAEVASLIGDPAIALVYSDLYLDRIEGLVPEDAEAVSPRSIFPDYERLAPKEDSTPEP